MRPLPQPSHITLPHCIFGVPFFLSSFFFTFDFRPRALIPRTKASISSIPSRPLQSAFLFVAPRSLGKRTKSGLCSGWLPVLSCLSKQLTVDQHKRKRPPFLSTHARIGVHSLYLPRFTRLSGKASPLLRFYHYLHCCRLVQLLCTLIKLPSFSTTTGVEQHSSYWPTLSPHLPPFAIANLRLVFSIILQNAQNTRLRGY